MDAVAAASTEIVASRFLTPGGYVAAACATIGAVAKDSVVNEDTVGSVVTVVARVHCLYLACGRKGYEDREC
jgi:hypothetical protein